MIFPENHRQRLSGNKFLSLYPIESKLMRKYKVFIFFFSAFLVHSLSFAQNTYSPCVGEIISAWNNCLAKASFADGSRYDGPYKNGKKNGYGKYYLSNGDIYFGQLVNDAGEGFGIHYMKNGDKYIGEFKENNYHGRGIYTFSNGQSKKEGIWENDNFKVSQTVNVSEVQISRTLDVSDQIRLGQMYRKGTEDTPRNGPEAAMWFKLSVNQGSSVAARELASMYWEGDGVQKDQKETFKWAKIAAEKGDPAGQRMLGLIYLYGLGVPKNEEEGIKWSRLAAQGGDSSAQLTVKAHDNNIDAQARWSRMQKMQFNIAVICVDPTGNGQDFNSARMMVDLLSVSTQAFASQIISSRECIQPKVINQFKNLSELKKGVVIKDNGKNIYLVYQDKVAKSSYGLIGVNP